MRTTRYVWISNLPSSVTEEELRSLLTIHEKIQNIKIIDDRERHGAIVTLFDSKCASRIIDSDIKLRKTRLKLQYCDSSGVLCHNLSASRSGSIQKSDQRSGSTSDSKSLAGEIDTDSTSSSTCSSHSSSPPLNTKKTTSTYPPIKRDHRKSHTSHDHYTRRDNHRSHKQEGFRGLRITQLPLRSSDTNLREGLFHEYKKHGKITSLLVKGTGPSRSAHITFKLPEDAEKAYENSKEKVFFGVAVHAELVDGLDIEDPDLCPPEHALDEYHPKATKTLFVGNLSSSTITQEELQRVFEIYGDIIEIDIKTQTNQPGTSYAFVQYTDIKSVVRALDDQESCRISGKAVKLGFGKSQPSNVVWLDNLAPNITETFLLRQFGRYGRLKDAVIDFKLCRALLYFDTVEAAQRALNETRNRSLLGKKVQIDYASSECQVAFMTKFVPLSNFYGKYRDKLQEFVSTYLPCGTLVSCVDENRGSQSGYDKRTKDLTSLIGLSESSRLCKHGHSRCSRHSTSYSGSPVRGSISSSRISPPRDYTDPQSPGFRSGVGSLPSLIGLSAYKDHSCTINSSRIATSSQRCDRSRHSRSRKSGPPVYSSLDGSRSSNGVGSYQNSVSHRNGDSSPRKQKSWSNKRSNDPASTCSDSSSIERLPNKKESYSHKHAAQHRQKSPSKRKSSTRSSAENLRHRDRQGHQQVPSGRRSVMETTNSTSEQNHLNSRDGSNDPREFSSNTANHDNKIKGSSNPSRASDHRQKMSVISSCSSNNETLTKLQRERVELLMKLSVLQTQFRPDTPKSSNSGQPQCNGGDIISNKMSALPESQPIQIPCLATKDGHFGAAESSGSAGQSSSSDPGDVMFSPNISALRTTSVLSSPHQPPPPPPPPLRLPIASPCLHSCSLHPSSFESIASPPPWDTQSTTIESDLPLLSARILSPSSSRDPRIPLSSNLLYSPKHDNISPRTSVNMVPVINKSQDSDSEPTDCGIAGSAAVIDSSLDERIRRLDARLLHSEKLRPTVDYSKFRIRRKMDTNTSSNSYQAVMARPNAIISSDSIASPLQLTSPTSPNVISSPSSPLSRPTDTSEFVKSMLSSSKPPSSSLKSAPRISTIDTTVASARIPDIPSIPFTEKTILLSPIKRSPYHTASPTCITSECQKLDSLGDTKSAVDSRSSTTHQSGATNVSSSSVSNSSLSHSPGSNIPHPPGVKSILKKEKGVAHLPQKTIQKNKQLQLKDLFSPEAAQQIHLMKKKLQVSQPPFACEREPAPSTAKRKLSTVTCQLPPKSPKLSMGVAKPIISDAEKTDKVNDISSPLSESVPDVKPGSNSSQFHISPSLAKRKKLREVPLAEIKQRKESLITSPVTPFERNKLHFRKLPNSNAITSPKLAQSSITPTQKPQKSLDVSGCRPRSKSDSTSKKKRLKRRKEGSGEDDWKPQGINLKPTKLDDIVTEGVLYESMYDKIKRRGNKDLTNKTSETKPEALKSLLKSRKYRDSGKAGKCPRKTSDGDERLSDTSLSYQHVTAGKRGTKKPPHLTPELSEPIRSINVNKKTRLKRPEGDSGSSSPKSDPETASKNRKRVLPVLKKRQVGGDAKSSSARASTKPRKSVGKRRLASKVPISLPSSDESNSSDSSPPTTNSPRAFFPTRRHSSFSSVASSTPRISRSCSPFNYKGISNDPEGPITDELPLLEKQIVSDAEDCENPETDLCRTSPLPELPATESSFNNEGDNTTDKEVPLKAEEITIKTSRSGGDLIVTSALVKSSPSKLDDNLEESGLALLSSAAEAIKQELIDLHKPVISSTRQQVITLASPTAILTPISVIPEPISSTNHITVVVNENASSNLHNPAFSKTPPTFLLAPSTFSLVSPVTVTADNKPIVFDQFQIPQATDQQSSNYTDYVQHIIRRVKREQDVENMQNRDRMKRTKKSVHHGSPPVIPGSPGVNLPPHSSLLVAKPPQIKLETPFSSDPYEPNFDDPEVADIPQPPKDTVEEVINSVVHGEFEQEEYVQQILKGTLLSSPSPSSQVGSCGSDMTIRPRLTSLSSSKPPLLLSTSLQTACVAQIPLTQYSPQESTITLSEDKDLPLRTNQSNHIVQSQEQSQIQASYYRSAPPQEHLVQENCDVSESTPLNQQATTLATISDPSCALTLIAPTTISHESSAQQISPQTQPQLQEIAARLASNYLSLFNQVPQTLDESTNLAPLVGTPAPRVPSESEAAEFYAAATMAAMATMPPSDVAIVPPSTASTPYSAPSPPPTAGYWWLNPLLLEKLPLLWSGYMTLKNDEASVRMLYLAGNRDYIHTCLHSLAPDGDVTALVLRITQRMRLESSQLEAVQWKLREPTNYCMCLALAGGAEGPRGATATALPTSRFLQETFFSQNNLILQNFINYLREKTAAGIISCPSPQENPFVMHIFPPCDFTTAQLRNISPDLEQTLAQCGTPFMLIVVV